MRSWRKPWVQSPSTGSKCWDHSSLTVAFGYHNPPSLSASNNQSKRQNTQQSVCTLWCKHARSIFGKTPSFPRASIRGTYGGMGVFKQREGGLRPWHRVQCETLSFLVEQVIEKMSPSFLIKVKWICCTLFWKRGCVACTQEKWATPDINWLSLFPLLHV